MRRQQGMTLIELVIAIVVIGICVTSVLALLSSQSLRSAAAMVRPQAAAIAASYLENILAQPYGAVGAFDGLDHAGAQDANGMPVPGLERYRVQVGASLASVGTGANATQAMRVDVTVTDPTGVATRMTGYRTNYAGQVVY